LGYDQYHSTILAGNNSSSTKTVEIITKICLAKIADGVVHRDVLSHVTEGSKTLTRKRLVTEFEALEGGDSK
jgi:hypothetical protein